MKNFSMLLCDWAEGKLVVLLVDCARLLPTE